MQTHHDAPEADGPRTTTDPPAAAAPPPGVPGTNAAVQAGIGPLVVTARDASGTITCPDVWTLRRWRADGRVRGPVEVRTIHHDWITLTSLLRMPIDQQRDLVDTHGVVMSPHPAADPTPPPRAPRPLSAREQTESGGPVDGGLRGAVDLSSVKRARMAAAVGLAIVVVAAAVMAWLMWVAPSSAIDELEPGQEAAAVSAR